jgi:hypothetical protein
VSGFELVAGVIAVFFVTGIGVGVLLMISLPVLRKRRGLTLDNVSDGADWEEPQDPSEDAGPRHWPLR